MPTDFSNHLRKKGYAGHVVRGGLEGLIKSWDSVTKGLAQANPAYLLYEEFLNDMDGRRILRECIELAEPEELHAVEERVAVADSRFRDNTVFTSRCIWGDDNARKHGFSSTVDWYYFRHPNVLNDSWPIEFRERAA
jgi:hypothetical protein